MQAILFLNLLVGIVLFILFAMQLYESVVKLRREDILQLVTKDRSGELGVPAVTFCTKGNFSHVYKMCLNDSNPGSCLHENFQKVDHVVDGVYKKDTIAMLKEGALSTSENELGQFHHAAIYNPLLPGGNCHTLSKKDASVKPGGVVAFHVPANVYYTVLLHDRRVVPRVVAPYREYLPVTRINLGELREHELGFLFVKQTKVTWLTRPKDGFTCLTDDNASLRECWEDKLLRTAGCQLETNQWRPTTQVPFCKNIEEVKGYFDALKKFRIFNTGSVKKIGCPLSCSINRTKLEDNGIYREILGPHKLERWRSDAPKGGAWIVLNFVQEELHVIQEILLYDVSSFVGEVGGALGLFMGWSCYSVYQFLVFAANKGCAKVKKKKKKKVKKVEA